MPNEGLSAAKSALAERRYTSAPSQRPQDSTQTVSLLSNLISQRETSRREKRNYRCDGRLTNVCDCVRQRRAVKRAKDSYLFFRSFATRDINFEEGAIKMQFEQLGKAPALIFIKV